MSDNWRKGVQTQNGRNLSKPNVPRVNDGTRFGNGQKSFSELGGDYLHCTLYKENKDTMDATNMIARFLKLKTTSFGFSGTKDRRAATVQRISVHRQRASNLIWLNSRLQGIRLGDFKHSKHPIQLGQHGGNEFVITLKGVEHIRGARQSIATRVKTIEESVEQGLRFVHENGFLNYFGLQRFGTHAIGTHELGAKILKEDFQGAIEDICAVPADLAQALASSDKDALVGYQQDDINRARALTIWRTSQNAKAALAIMPKRYSAEYRIIEHLSRHDQRRDYIGAILTITRGLRQMYIHGYQSLVWNHVASLRWAKYGSRVIEGDLIMLDLKPKQSRPLDGDDDDIPDPSGDWEDFYAHVRHLTADDIASGKYTIFDIVLPQPGYDVIYPKNDVGEFYKTFMATKEGGELDPYNMRRKQKEFSLSGGYRNLVGRFMTTPEYLVRTYSNDEEQMYPTDLDLVLEKKAQGQAEIKDLKRRRSLVEPAPASGPVAEEAAAAHNKRAKVAGDVDVVMADAPAPAAASEADSRSAFLLAKLRELAPASPPAAAASSSAGGALAAVPASGPASRPAAPAAPALRQISGDIATKFAPGRYTWKEAGHGDKIAVILKFQLQSSSYATVVLRELQTALAGERNPKCE
jgi:tRNA pseudouridine13 synthase